MVFSRNGAKIKRNYILAIVFLICAFAVFPILIILECNKVFSTFYYAIVGEIIIAYMVLFMIAIFFFVQYLRILSSLYHRYMIAFEDPRLNSNTFQQNIVNSFSNITFSDIFKIRILRRNEKVKIKRSKSELLTFEILKHGDIGIIFYNQKNLHSYAIMVILNENKFIVLDDAFTKPLFRGNKVDEVKTRYIKNEFEKWANINSVIFDYFKVDEDL